MSERRIMRRTGIEPATLWPLTRRFNQLSYAAKSADVDKNMQR